MKTEFSDLKISINNYTLERIGNDCTTKSIKFLGVHFDECLTWQCHINTVSKKISSALFMISQVKNIIPKKSLKTLYFSLIQSHMTYGLLVWGNASQSHISRIQTLQKRAIRIITKSKYNSHTDPLFSGQNILKFSDLYEYQVLLFVFDQLCCHLPSSFVNLFHFNHDVQTNYLTRQSNNLYVPFSKRQFPKNLPIFHFPAIWNKWSSHLIDLATVKG